MTLSERYHELLGLVLGAPQPLIPKAPPPPLPAHVAQVPLNPRLLAVHVAAADKPRPGACWASGGRASAGRPVAKRNGEEVQAYTGSAARG